MGVTENTGQSLPIDQSPLLRETIVQKFEDFLNVKRVHIDIRKSFKETGIGYGKSLDEYLNLTTAHIQLYDCYQNCAPFLKEYKSKFHKTAFADPYIRFKWSLGQKITEEEYEKAIIKRDFLRNWIFKDILPQNNDSGNLGHILIMPSEYIDESYRHQYDGKTLEEGARGMQGFGFKDSLISILPGLPFFNVPFAQSPYQSTVTERTEYVPGNIGFVAPKGSDAAMLDLVAAFLDATPGLYSSVTTGATAFPVEYFCYLEYHWSFVHAVVRGIIRLFHLCRHQIY
ncbi:hypothetical protein GGR58DRAFT_529263 [Xylaria digitata]|nr:hypothetical protein GGR58DRAFT_529263 [Xylaria digitata]